ncbi:hypothetical protein [Microbacterium elymi]|uniref:Flagellar FliJ protein n=1 Tax=Microbacterium elymi TaxID=2909587 RepID=A0ABY5NLJ6_9MICO|nr:hypothetical protein [Microbacterium elymi]UUT36057.1 hypothetical protein L2X98_23485 [Microbacterium elymi]
MSRSFSLAGLLRVRSVQEREAAQRLSRAAVEANQTAARDRRLRAALGGADPETMDSASLAALAASRASARAMLADVSALSALQQQEVRTARTAHDARRREVRGLEKLAQAHLRQVRADELRAEQVELDEIALRMRADDA